MHSPFSAIFGSVVLVFLAAMPASAQEETKENPTFSDANIFGSVGFIPLYGTLNGNLEILLTKFSRRS
jgi:hypothetical protein